NPSTHHSSTFPITSCRPYGFARYEPISACAVLPSSKFFSQLLQCSPLCVFPKESATFAAPFSDATSAPVQYTLSVPARAAHSHCASLGSARPSRFAACMQSFQLTFSTGCNAVHPLKSRFHVLRYRTGPYPLGFAPVKRSHWACVISYFERK